VLNNTQSIICNPLRIRFTDSSNNRSKY